VGLTKFFHAQVLTMSEGSFIFNLWLKPPVPVYLKVYIFNVTNAEEFLKGGVKLKLQQVGPYVYRCAPKQIAVFNFLMRINQMATEHMQLAFLIIF